MLRVSSINCTLNLVNEPHVNADSNLWNMTGYEEKKTSVFLIWRHSDQYAEVQVWLV